MEKVARRRQTLALHALKASAQGEQRKTIAEPESDPGHSVHRDAKSFTATMALSVSYRTPSTIVPRDHTVCYGESTPQDIDEARSWVRGVAAVYLKQFAGFPCIFALYIF